MLLTFYLLFIGLHVSEGCTLENRGEVLNIAAHAGGSVLLPCYCTDQHTTPERFSWKKDNKDTWEEISIESGQYRDRVQLFNGHSPGNVSLLISHLTEEDGGDYQCSVEGAHLIIRLTVKGCPLENRGEVLNITAHAGGSALLPCYCPDLHTKVKTFRWKKQNRSTHKQEEISSESGQYRDRVQVFNGHSPGNLSLLISHLTEEDGGDYICAVKGSRLTIILTVKGCPLENRGEVLNITAHAGGSALLPCYCPDLHTKVKTFRWKKQNRSTHKQEEISSESGQYRDRVQMFNGHSPGNLSLLISHLTEEDGGDYICAVEGSRLTIKLTVKGKTFPVYIHK
uniref:Ig-like domain-containing protein n=1 Tax=Pygocentrus nattereri TaxID=42514 RepID=A0AAR2JHW5_PYGNA